MAAGFQLAVRGGTGVTLYAYYRSLYGIEPNGAGVTKERIDLFFPFSNHFVFTIVGKI